MIAEPFAQIAFYTALFSLCMLIIIFVLLVLKLGDISFFVGVILGILGLISTIASLICTFKSWKLISLHPDLYSGKDIFIFTSIVNGVYLLFAIFAGIFLGILFFGKFRL